MKEKKRFLNKLRNKYRLVILNDDTFEEKVSIKLSRFNVAIFLGGSVIFLITSMIFIIAFTPLREYIPGYASDNVRRQALKLSLKTDSLAQSLAYSEAQLISIQNILRGTDPNADSALTDSSSDIVVPDMEVLNASAMENDLRDFVETEDQFNLPVNQSALSHFSFFTPVKGVLTSKFSPKDNHLAVDIVAEKNAPVKACLTGTVLFAEWTSNTGYVMIVQHNQNLVSCYKHNAALLKSPGDLVRTGEVIALIGNSGEQSTGPHLHFELWHLGNPVNPENFIAF